MLLVATCGLFLYSPSPSRMQQAQDTRSPNKDGHDQRKRLIDDAVAQPNQTKLDFYEWISRNENDAMQQPKADFDWAIHPREGYPRVVTRDQVEFKYTFQGTLSEKKRFFFTVGQVCGSHIADAGRSFITYSTYRQELIVRVGFDATLTDSPLYTATHLSAGTVAFCLRVDYELEGESISFQETRVNIPVRLNKGLPVLQATMVEPMKEVTS
jgi:hypothetical protein